MFFEKQTRHNNKTQQDFASSRRIGEKFENFTFHIFRNLVKFLKNSFVCWDTAPKITRLENKIATYKIAWKAQ